MVSHFCQTTKDGSCQSSVTLTPKKSRCCQTRPDSHLLLSQKAPQCLQVSGNHITKNAAVPAGVRQSHQTDSSDSILPVSVIPSPVLAKLGVDSNFSQQARTPHKHTQTQFAESKESELRCCNLNYEKTLIEI